MYPIRQSTALTLPFFAHDASGNAVTGLLDGSFTKRISKNGAAFGAMTVTITERENGWYSIPLSTSHSDTLGLLSITFTNAGAKQVNLQYRVSAKLIDDLNDVAATDIVSAGAITTLAGAVVNVDTVDLSTTTTTATNLTTNNDKTGYSLAATGLDAIVSTALGMVEIAKAMWDRILTAATHNITNSAGRRVRQLEGATVLRSGTAQAGANNSITLDAGASGLDNFFNHARVLIVGNTAAEQERLITDYDGTTKIAIITPAWVVNPDVTSLFEVIPGLAHAETQGGGYETGVHINTITGVAGTQLYVNGTSDNPVNSIADARTLADALNIKTFDLKPGSTITLAQTFTSFVFTGSGYTVDLGSQDVSGCRFLGGAVEGIGSGSARIVLRECIVQAPSTFPLCSLLSCNLNTTTIILADVGTYNIDSCFGAGATIDVGTALGNTTLNIHHWSGNLQVESVGDTGVDAINLEGTGSFIEGTCTGGNVKIAGPISLSGITNLTISEVARLDTVDIDDIQTRIPVALISGRMNSDIEAINDLVASAQNLARSTGAIEFGTVEDPPAASTTVFQSDLAETQNDIFIGRVVIFLTGPAKGEATEITDYTGATGTVAVEALANAPVNGNAFIIV